MELSHLLYAGRQPAAVIAQAVPIRRAIVRKGAAGFPEADRETWQPKLLMVAYQDRADILWSHVQLGQILSRLKDKGKRDRIARWRAWIVDADKGRPGAKLKSWVAPTEGDYLVAVETADGTTVIRPAEVAEAFAEEWGELWQPDPGNQALDRLCADMASGPDELPPSLGRT